MTRALLANHRPDDPICFGAGAARTAAQLAAFARAVAAALPEANAGRVVIACSDRYHFSVALAATWLRGFVAELPSNGQPATVHALADADGTLALLHDRDETHGLDIRTLEPSLDAAGALPLTVREAAGEVGLIAYTSGSTGAPVPHEKTLTQLFSEPQAHLASFALAGKRIVAAVPPYHIYGLLFGVLVPLLGGGSMSRSAPLLPAELLREIESERADVLVAVPPHLTALAEHAASTWPRLSHVFSSAAPLPAATSQTLAARGLVVTEVLGSTETGGIAYRRRTIDPWTPLSFVQIAVDEDGVLGVDSPWLPPDATRPVRTADRVERVEGGFRHLGRSDAVVKIGGRRVDLGEIEARLKECEGVRDARVLSVESPGMRGIEVLAVVESDSAEPAALKRSLALHIDPVAIPRRIRVVPSLPRSVTGKIAKKDLLALFDVWAFSSELLADGTVRIVVPRKLGYFRGHFEGQPILPGVVQLSNLALREARQRFPELGPLVRVTRVKFKRLIVPGETLLLTLARKGPGQVQFAIDALVDDVRQPAASGLLHFQGSAP